MAKKTTSDKMGDKLKNNFEKVKLDIQRKKELAEKNMDEKKKDYYPEETTNLQNPPKSLPNNLHDKLIIEETHNVKFLNFSLNNTEYAIELKYVNEIVRYSGVVKIPRSKEYLVGIINLRDQIISVVNIGYFLDEVEFLPNDNSRIIIITVDQILYGILVNKVSQVLNISSNSIRNFQESEKGRNGKVLKGIDSSDNGDKITLLLDISKFGFIPQ
ncbi:chemotaxis protein CheW [Pseudobacteroides cellulosolvens]|uniref:CheW protein n=1 Tax=Pseudobacteroides cellulosolvens ATCC 35603 = DSM 2933 TaxID=398512 RepID=A0A0L6JKM0_9FIRM|nr:chemotaxis protein CheW [Pseudobacteroides cellulosolvens]KNY26300.1 CheW protein [Pseudobacteroides cellulosolvens ATCC 35603 = DSM 2933]